MNTHPQWYYKYYDQVMAYRRNYDSEIAHLDTIIALEGKSIQEIGAGSGNHAIRLLKKKPKCLDLVDFDPTAIDILKKKFLLTPCIRILHEDGFLSSTQEKYDVILCMFSIILLSIDCLSELEYRVEVLVNRLNPNGYLFFELVDYDVCKRIHGGSGKNKIFSDQNNVVYIQSAYTNRKLEFEYTGFLDGHTISYKADLMRTNKQDIALMLGSMSISNFGFISLDDCERRLLVYAKK